MYEIILAPFWQNIATTEVAYKSLSLIDKLAIGFGPLGEELVEILHLSSAPMIHSSKLLFLDVHMPVFESLSTGLDTSVSV